MGGSARKPDKPGPSYEDGKLRDAEIEKRQREAATDGADERAILRSLVKKAARTA